MPSASSENLCAIFAGRGWLCRQPAAVRNAIVQCGRLQRLDAGQPVFRDGDVGGGIYGIVSGAVACEVTTPLSGPSLVHVMQKGWWFGEGPMLFDRRRTMSFVAQEPTTLLLVPLQAIRALEREDPGITRLAGQLAEISAMLAIDAGCELLIRDARQRLAAVLLRVTACLEGVSPDNPRGFKITQSQLAEMSNLSRHHANVALLELQSAGIIALDYGRISIRSPQRLAQFAAGS